MYWPWYAFVESHGGYAALLAHQRGYLAGIGSWPGHLWLQLAESRALSGDPFWTVYGGFAAGLALVFIANDMTSMRRILSRIVYQLLVLPVFCLIPNATWLYALGAFFAFFLSRRMAEEGTRVFLCAGWLTLTLITPFYHPYARLWLPIEAFGWLFMGGLFASESERLHAATIDFAPRKRIISWLVAIAAAAIAAAVGVFSLPRHDDLPGLLAPTDSLRLASVAVARDLPADLKTCGSWPGRR